MADQPHLPTLGASAAQPAVRWPRAAALVLLCLAAGGCSTWQQAKSTGPPPLSEAQRQWWAENRERARYIHGRGYYVDGTSGFFDADGRPISASSSPDATSDDFIESSDPLAFLSPANTYKKFQKLIGKGPSEPVARQAFQEGEVYFHQKQYDDAAGKFQVAIDRWPDSPLEEDAMFRRGEALFFADRYSKADDAYAELIKKYPSTQYLDVAVSRRFAIGRYWQQKYASNPHWPVRPNLTDKTQPLFDTFGHALRVYERVRLDDPTGPLADDSVMAVANAYFVQGRYDDADFYYTLLRTDYPKSEHQLQAHILGLQAKMQRYQGAEYDSKPLDEAEELARQMLKQFPRELGDERERTVQALARIHRQKAEHEFARAEYYAKGEHYKAARIHYENVLQNYPDTQLAEASRARIVATRDLPDHPTSPVAWLVDLFPESQTPGTAPAGAAGGRESPAAVTAAAPGGVQR